MAEPAPRLVLGLGNPGAEYEGTRHNVGFDVVDVLSRRSETRFRKSGRALAARGEAGGAPFVLGKPQTFMNNSGRAAREFVEELGPATQLLVLCDDFHLPLGRLRCRAAGSDGGQKGLQSVIAALAERDVPRLRLGIDEPPPNVPAEDYVLRRFKRAEQAAAVAMIERAADCVMAWLEHGDLQRLIREANAPPPG